MVNDNITNRVYCSRKLGGRGSYPQEARVQRVNTIYVQSINVDSKIVECLSDFNF